MSGASGFNGGTVGGTCDVGGGEIMGDQPWGIAGGSKLRIGGNAPDGGKYVAGIVGEAVNGNLAISGFLDGVESLISAARGRQGASPGSWSAGDDGHLR